MSIEERYSAFEKAKNYTKQYELEKIDSIVTRQEDDMLGYISAGQFATTGSNIFVGGQIVLGNITIDGDIHANQFIVTTASVNHFTASTNFGLDAGDIHTFTGSVRITGSLNTIGNSTITGSFLVSGSTTQIGNNTLLGNTYLYGDIDVSGSTNFHNHTITMTGSMFTSGSQTITGSLDINGNINIASGSAFYRAGNKLFNYGQWIDTTIQSGNIDSVQAMKFNQIQYQNGISIVSGSRIKVDNTGLYNLQFSSQFDNADNTNVTVHIWFAITGSAVANSATQLDINKAQAGNLGKIVAAWNFMTELSASNYIELMWSSNSAAVTMYGTGSNSIRPGIPSVIATMTQIA